MLPVIPRDILMQPPHDQSQRREHLHCSACHGLATIPELGATLLAAAGDTVAVRLCYGAAFKIREESYGPENHQSVGQLYA
jgi:hypothetical protein